MPVIVGELTVRVGPVQASANSKQAVCALTLSFPVPCIQHLDMAP